MANVWRVGFPDGYVEEGSTTSLDQKLVGLLNVEHDSVIVLTPDGDVALFMADDIPYERMLQAKTMQDLIMLAVNG